MNGGFGSDRLTLGAVPDRFFHAGVAGRGSDFAREDRAAEGDVLLRGGGAATAGRFQVDLGAVPGAGAAGVDEAFVICRPSGQILRALVDGGAQGRIDPGLGGQVFDLLARGPEVAPGEQEQGAPGPGVAK